MGDSMTTVWLRMGDIWGISRFESRYLFGQPCENSIFSDKIFSNTIFILVEFGFAIFDIWNIYHISIGIY